MAKKTKIYCVYCGTANLLEDKKCSKCKKKLDPKNRPVYDYLKDQLKDKVEGTLQDNIFSIITNFIQTHLYGTVLTCSIIFAVVSGISSIISHPVQYDTTNKRPIVSVKYEYLGEGLDPKEIVNKYGDALNAGNLKEARSYELKTFYPQIFEELKGSKYKISGRGEFSFLSNNKLIETSGMVFKNEKEYGVGFYYASTPPEGKYGDYEFIRHPLYVEYAYGDIVSSPYDKKEEAYAFDYSIEFIKVDDNYYISGTQLDPLLTAEHKTIYDFFVKYKGDTTKFSYVDIKKHLAK